MQLNISPSSPVGRIKAPPSKSAAHRLLICAGLSTGKSTVSGAAFSEDIKATLNCLETLGAEIEINGSDITVSGARNSGLADGKIFDCNESGSTLRFFIPICLLNGGKITFTGSEKLMSRPLSVYQKICENQKIKFDISDNKLTLDGRLHADSFEIQGNISSQFISGLLFALPLLKEKSQIKILPPFESRPYVDMTLDALKKFGVRAEFSGENIIEIEGGQSYQPCSCEVEGDWSNAAFFYAFKESGADVEITGTDKNSLQGDKICIDYFRKIKNGFCTLDLSDCPDLAPILFAFAAKHGGALFTGTDRLRMKESDRIGCMRQELMKFGADMEEGDNRILIKKCEIHKPNEPIFSHNDHRIVMSMAYLLTFTGGTIDGYEAVRKSCPDFFEILKNAGVKINYEA